MIFEEHLHLQAWADDFSEPSILPLGRLVETSQWRLREIYA